MNTNLHNLKPGYYWYTMANDPLAVIHIHDDGGATLMGTDYRLTPEGVAGPPGRALLLDRAAPGLIRPAAHVAGGIFPMTDLLLKNVRSPDGRRVDVAIRQGRIAALGERLGARMARVAGGRGRRRLAAAWPGRRPCPPGQDHLGIVLVRQ